MKKGIIMEINEQYVTMLTPQGEFLRARKINQDYELGEEIDFFPVEQTVKETRSHSFLSIFSFLKTKGAYAAAFALMLAVASFLPFYTDDEVYAYMSIDINPSIELGVNEDLEVIEINSYNNDGKAVVERLDWKKQPLKTVTESIIEETEELGYLEENKEVIVTTVVAVEHDKETDKKIKEELSTVEKDLKTDKIEVSVVEATVEERTEAKNSGISVGKYKQQQKIKTNIEINKKDHNQSTTPTKKDNGNKQIENGKGNGQEREKGRDNVNGNGQEREKDQDNGKGNGQNEKSNNKANEKKNEKQIDKKEKDNSQKKEQIREKTKEKNEHWKEKNKWNQKKEYWKEKNKWEQNNKGKGNKIERENRNKNDKKDDKGNLNRDKSKNKKDNNN